MNLNKKFKEDGYIFFKLNNRTKLLITKINNLIIKYKKEKKINFDDIESRVLSKHILALQKKVNNILSTEKFFKINKDIFYGFFNENKYSVQAYFYLRLTQPSKKNPKIKPINFHRESFYGPSFYKNMMNVWIPIKNCEKKNAMKYVKKSHLFKKNKEINFSPRNTNIIKGSTENKIGHLYKDRKIDFKKKVETSRLYKKEHFILFYGDLIHGNAKNLTNKTRISLDLRFLFKKHMKYNPVQGITKKKYFKVINI